MNTPESYYFGALKRALEGDLEGSFSFLEKAEKIREDDGYSFSEPVSDSLPFVEEAVAILLSSYDFTRCVRQDGSIYGTKGKCRKGKETTKAAAEKVRERAAKMARQRKNQNPERKALYDRLAKLANQRAQGPYEQANQRRGLTQEDRDQRRESDAYMSGLYPEPGRKIKDYGPGGRTSDPRKKRKQEALGENP